MRFRKAGSKKSKLHTGLIFSTYFMRDVALALWSQRRFWQQNRTLGIFGVISMVFLWDVNGMEFR